ncbi:hypothetical protein ACTRW9_09410 [Nitrospina sp. 32_T5]|uniref:hypothetical protein n=1 Tax=unclassified Nitrospina TaxID=2638683 RepID=UPI003F9DD87A
MKPLALPSILLTGLFVFSGILPEVVSAGGGSAGFHSSFNRSSGFKSRIGPKFQSSIQRRIRTQQGFRDGRTSSFRGSRRQGVSPLRRKFLFGPNELRNRLDENSRKIQNDVIRDGQDFRPRHPGFKIKQRDTRRQGNKGVRGPGFHRRHPGPSPFSLRPFQRHGFGGPFPFVGPFQPFVFSPGFGVLRFPLGPTTNITAFPGRSDFSERILDRTQGIGFKTRLRDQTVWHILGPDDFAADQAPQSSNKKRRSHHHLKRMKNGQKVFSDFGGRVIGETQTDSEAPPSPFSLR